MRDIKAGSLLVLLMTLQLAAQGVGTLAPNFTHNTLDDGQISLSDFSGQVVYLSFFGWG